MSHATLAVEEFSSSGFFESEEIYYALEGVCQEEQFGLAFSQYRIALVKGTRRCLLWLYELDSFFFGNGNILLNFRLDLSPYIQTYSTSRLFISADSTQFDLPLFYQNLSALRGNLLHPENVTHLQQAVEFINQGNFQQALTAVESIQSSHFVGHHFLKYHLLNNLGRTEEAADAIVESTVYINRFNNNLLSDLFSFKFNGLQLYNIKRNIDLPEELSEFSLIQLLWMARHHFLQGKQKEALSLIQIIVSSISNLSDILFFITIGEKLNPVELVYDELIALGMKVDELILENPEQAELGHFIKKFLEILIVVDFDQSMEMLINWSREMSIESRNSALMIENWEAGTVLELQPIQEDLWTNLPYNSALFEQCYNNCKEILDLNVDVERYWAFLRCNNIEHLQNGWCYQNPESWYALLRNVFAKSNCNLWRGCLVAVEILMHQGHQHLAEQLLLNGYEDAAQIIETKVDNYCIYGTDIFGFYNALLQKQNSVAKNYMATLLQHPGFMWTQDLFERQFGEAPKRLGTNVDLDNFISWSNYVSGQLQKYGPTDDLKGQISNLSHYQQQKDLRVVIGGETSAGKSTFINRIIGYPLLATTEEEATAVPTFIKKAPFFSIRVYNSSGLLHKEKLEHPITKERWRGFRQTIKKYTFLASKTSNVISKVILSAPIKHFPENIVFIDTPGLNAHALRTKKAMQTLENSHACLFLMDAVSAAKSTELHSLRIANDLVVKCFFILNKIDRIIPDEDDDFDEYDEDEDIVEDTILRIKKDLQKHLHTKNINLFPVCSLTEKALQAKNKYAAVEYAKNIGMVRTRLLKQLQNAQKDLLLLKGCRLADKIANCALKISHRNLLEHGRSLAVLQQQLPPNPATFGKQIQTMVSDFWLKNRIQYENNLGASLEEALEECNQKIINSLNQCSSRSDLKTVVGSRVKHYFSHFIGAIEQAREEQWRQIAQLVSHQIQDLFNELCETAEYSSQLNVQMIINKATPLPLSQSVAGLSSSVDGMVGEADLAEVGGFAVGALVGTVILPGIGTAIGAWLGGTAGNAFNEDLVKNIYNKIFDRMMGIRELIVERLEADISGEDGNEILIHAVLSEAEKERARFAQVLQHRMNLIELASHRQKQGISNMKTVITDASNWHNSFDSIISKPLDL